MNVEVTWRWETQIFRRSRILENTQVTCSINRVWSTWDVLWHVYRHEKKFERELCSLSSLLFSAVKGSRGDDKGVVSRNKLPNRRRTTNVQQQDSRNKRERIQVLATEEQLGKKFPLAVQLNLSCDCSPCVHTLCLPSSPFPVYLSTPRQQDEEGQKLCERTKLYSGEKDKDSLFANGVPFFFSFWNRATVMNEVSSMLGPLKADTAIFDLLFTSWWLRKLFLWEEDLWLSLKLRFLCREQLHFHS